VTLATLLNNSIESFKAKNGSRYAQLIESINEHDSNNANANDDENSKDALWKFALISISLLEAINESKFEPNVNHCYISIADDRLLNSCCELFVCFGIHYSLEDNVGVPIEKLSKFGVNILKCRAGLNAEIRNRRLSICLDYLLHLKENKREHVDLMASKFERKYLHEILSALIQVCYSPNSLLNAVECQGVELATAKKNRNAYLNWLERDLFEQVDGASMVSSLIMLQGTPKAKPPGWFLSVVGFMLTKCLLRPNSVMNVIRAVLSEIDAVADVSLASDWKKCDIVAKILAQCPKQLKLEEYMRLLAPQIAQLFFNNDLRYARHFYRVAGSVYAQFARRWPQETRHCFTREILAPHFSLFLTSTSLDEAEKTRKSRPEVDDILISSTELRKYLSNLNLVYINSTEPAWPTLDQLPEQLVQLLFEIYNQTRRKIKAKSTCKHCEDMLKLYVRMMPAKVSEFLSRTLEFGLVLDDNRNRFGESEFYFELEKLCFDEYDDCSDQPSLIRMRLNNEAQLKINDGSRQSPSIQAVQERCRSLSELLDSIADNEITMNFMFYLFERLQSNWSSSSSSSHESTAAFADEAKEPNKTDKSLLRLESQINAAGHRINTKILNSTQLSILFEQAKPQLIIDKQEKVIEFCRRTLESLVKLMKEENEGATEQSGRGNLSLFFFLMQKSIN
jgi:hypothetical protein